MCRQPVGLHCQGGEEREGRESVLNVLRISSFEFGGLLEMGGGDGFNDTVTQSHREMVKPVDFILLFIVILN